MIRKFMLTAAALAALGTAALTTTATPAAAWHGGFHHHHFHGFGHGWHGGYRFAPRFYDSCLRSVLTINRFGEPVRRMVNVCY